MEIASKLRTRIVFLALLICLAGCVVAFGQRFPSSSSKSRAATPPAPKPAIAPLRSLAADNEEYVEPEFLGAYRPDGRFKAASRRGLADLDRNPSDLYESPRIAVVPGFIDPHPLERVVEDYAPPAHATKAARGDSAFGHLRDDIITFLYGHERVLRFPTQLTTDSRERLIIADPSQAAVHVLDGKRSFRIAGGMQRRLQRPNGIAVDDQDNIYVADGERGMILVYDAQGRFLRYLGSFQGESLFANPTGVAIDRKSGRLYVLDTPADQLVVLDLHGRVLKRVGDRRNKLLRVRFDQPTGIALANNALVVLDSAGSRIQVLDLDGNPLTTFSIANVTGKSAAPEMGVALGAAGNIYVSNVGWGKVRVYRRDGRYLGSFGRSGIFGMWVNDAGRIYAADKSQGRVLVFHPAATPAHRPGTSLTGNTPPAAGSRPASGAGTTPARNSTSPPHR